MSTLAIIIIIFGILILIAIIIAIILLIIKKDTCNKLQPPTNVTATINANIVTVNWTGTDTESDIITGYNIYAGQKPDFNPLDSSFLVGSVSGITTFTISLIIGSGNYYFKVSSFRQTSNKKCESILIPSNGVLISI